MFSPGFILLCILRTILSTELISTRRKCGRKNFNSVIPSLELDGVILDEAYISIIQEQKETRTTIKPCRTPAFDHASPPPSQIDNNEEIPASIKVLQVESIVSYALILWTRCWYIYSHWPNAYISSMVWERCS